jgi:type I restriction enzyme R subunit
MLMNAGWDVDDRTKVVTEVDTKQSDFKARNYKTVDETLKNDAESAYADYLLLDNSGSQISDE